MLTGTTLLVATIVLVLRRATSPYEFAYLGVELYELLFNTLVIAGNAPQDVEAALQNLDEKLAPPPPPPPA